MEESDSGQQQKRCPCGFWGSPQTSGLCSKCYKATIQEKTQDIDPKAELMRNTERQSQYSSHDSLAPGPSSFLSSARATASTIEKAEEFIRQAVKNSNNVDKTESSTNTTANANETDSAKVAIASSSTAYSKPAATSDTTVGTNIANSESIVVGDKIVKNGSEIEGSKDANAGSISGESLPDTPEKKGIKRDRTDMEDSAPDSSPEKAETKSKKKCATCKCRMELAQRAIGRCRCDNVYCSLHRLPEQHKCPFDHKEDGRREARQKMVKPTRHLGTSFKRLGSDS